MEKSLAGLATAYLGRVGEPPPFAQTNQVKSMEQREQCPLKEPAHKPFCTRLKPRRHWAEPFL